MDGFAVALEAEVAWPDDARMHGTDGHLVNARPFDAEERMRGSARAVVPGTRFENGVPAERFEPRMPVGADAVVFEQLALERLRLRELRRECRIAPVVGNAASEQTHASTRIVADHREDFLLFLRILRRQPAERRESTAPRADVEAGAPKVRDRNVRNVRSGNREAVPGPEQ
jgi:hypothetical protein